MGPEYCKGVSVLVSLHATVSKLDIGDIPQGVCSLRQYIFLLCCIVGTQSLAVIGWCRYSYVPLYPLAGLSVAPNFTPPEEVRSSIPALTGSTRYNLNTGVTFNISCVITHASDAFTGYFYKDGVLISDGDLVDTTLTETTPSPTQKIIYLQFLNFQPVHDGAYYCFANASATNETASSDLYLYGSGKDCRHVCTEVDGHVL